MIDEPIDVSVIVPAWKAEAFIGRAISSALASAGVSVEVVAIDDASPDDTFGALKRIAASDPRVVVERLPVNAGPSAARNRAIELSKGRFIAVLDADDAIAPDRFAHLVSLAERTKADIVVDNMIEVDEAGQRVSGNTFLKSNTFAASRDIDLNTWVNFNLPMKGRDCLGYLKPLFRRSAIEKYAAAYDENLRNSEDYYIVAHMLAAGARMTYSSVPGYLYTRSTSSTSHRLRPEQTAAWLEAERRFRALFDNTLGPQELANLDRRARALQDVNHLVATVDAVKARNAGAIFGNLASDLHGSAFTLSTFAKIAMRKALRLKSS
jgi:succinoglycan biosynthesis protein ExoO